MTSSAEPSENATTLEKLAGWPEARRDWVFYLAALPTTVIVVGLSPYLFQAYFFPGPMDALLSLSLQVVMGAAVMGMVCYGLTRALSTSRGWGPARHRWPVVSHLLILWIPAALLVDAPLRLSELRMLGQAALSQEIIPYILGVSFGRAFLFAGGIVFYERLMGSVMETANYRQMALRLETQTLKALIQPHFMLNSLNAIRANIEDAPEIADQMILSLTTILRMVIDFSGMERVSLSQEMELVEEYVAFMNRRFETSVRLAIDPKARSMVSIPPLIIFSLVENSFKHGFSGRGAGSISISAQAGGRFRIIVDDDGSAGSPPETSGGTGGQYVASRLRLGYGEDFSFTHGRMENGHYQAVIEIPWEGAGGEP